ncbi:ABC transporter substrate-binding protein [Auraticoccus monumenti]|uniref:Carbohydrate ABC transporter substrate-binding protein, CUT1 family n=1 Tax=Auraticoccus monumenti TaxID=675864 RepID=A0A1G6T756_9ACTN|nr:extracellular solute-binding protein [Auraticoccus monumenti]SDD24793.1 carbohydrate ABC transporter substrate-binding protein, CUT1 family [Auraticoccus monumenti]
MYPRLSTHLSRRTALKLGLGTTVLGAVGTGAACAPVTPDSGGPGGENTFTVYWNAGHAYDAYQQVIDQFGKDHDLVVNWQKFQWPDLATKLVADFRGGNVPDLVEEAGTGSIQYGVQGNVMALDDLAANTSIGFPDDFLPESISARQHEGRTYAVPLHLTANGLLFYDKAKLADAGFSGPPTTWEEFREVARATTRDDVSGFAMNADYSYSAPWYLQREVTYASVADGGFLVPEDTAAEVYTFLQDLVHTDEVSPAPVATTDYSGPQKLFSAGRAAMFLTGPWDLGPVRQGSPDIDLGVAEPLTGTVQASSLAGAGLMIPAKARNPELSWELVGRLTAVETELAATAATGMSMPRKSWAESPEVAGDEVLSTIAAAVGLVKAESTELAARGVQTQVADLFKAAYEAMIIQNRPVPETLARFREQARGVLG